jgi:putative nucleotidyltransferase with HDIG domain
VDTLLTPCAVSPNKRANAKPLEIDSLISKTPFLPPAFELIPRLLLILDSPDKNADEIAEVIRVDPNLTADILRVANSANFASRQRTDSLSNAIIRVGLREIFHIVLEIISAPAFNSKKNSPIHKIDLWRHSLSTAVASQVLASEVSDIDPEVAFTAGLLHDIGKVVLSNAAGDKYFHMLLSAAENNIPVVTAEHTEFGITHTDAAGRLLKAWHFPEPIREAILHHHNPFAAKQHGLLAAIVYFGNILSYRLGHGHGFPPYAADPDPDALQLLNLEPAYLKHLEEQVLELFRREEERFQ